MPLGVVGVYACGPMEGRERRVRGKSCRAVGSLDSVPGPVLTQTSAFRHLDLRARTERLDSLSQK